MIFQDVLVLAVRLTVPFANKVAYLNCLQYTVSYYKPVSCHFFAVF